MSVNTVLLDLSVGSGIYNLGEKDEVIEKAEGVLKQFLPNLCQVFSHGYPDGVMKFYRIEEHVTVNFRMYKNGFITINIEYFTPAGEEPIITLNVCGIRGKHEKFTTKEYKRHPCEDLDSFRIVLDERLIEYDIDAVVFEERSPYQKVQIVHSKTLGNMLVLDDLQNISEADLIYTETLMDKGIENYKDKEICILGGGDGALLFELLKENPKEVIMLEIDETVMKACAKYMRSICGDVLDTYEGPNYKIILGDCMKTLSDFIKNGRKFDYVFGDLTDVPISEGTNSELWTFIKDILIISFQVLKPGTGKFMTHLIGSVMKDSISQYMGVLDLLQPPVNYTLKSAFVPSFLESWEFCRVEFKPTGAFSKDCPREGIANE